MTSRRLPRPIIDIDLRLWERLKQVQQPQVVTIVATRWNCTLTGIGSNSHHSQKMISTVIRLQLMKMSFTFSVSKISELFLHLNKKKIIIILGGDIDYQSSQSVWLGRMRKLGLEWSKGPDLLLSRGGHRSIVSGNQIYHIGGRWKK